MIELAQAIDTRQRTRLHEVRRELEASFIHKFGKLRIGVTIGDLSRWLGVPPHTLRHWEEAFGAQNLTSLPRRARNNWRQFSRKDALTIACIQWLLHVEMYTTEGAKRQLKLAREAEHAT